MLCGKINSLVDKKTNWIHFQDNHGEVEFDPQYFERVCLPSVLVTCSTLFPGQILQVQHVQLPLLSDGRSDRKKLLLPPTLPQVDLQPNIFFNHQPSIHPSNHQARREYQQQKLCGGRFDLHGGNILFGLRIYLLLENVKIMGKQRRWSEQGCRRANPFGTSKTLSRRKFQISPQTFHLCLLELWAPRAQGCDFKEWLP